MEKDGNNKTTSLSFNQQLALALAGNEEFVRGVREDDSRHTIESILAGAINRVVSGIKD